MTNRIKCQYCPSLGGGQVGPDRMTRLALDAVLGALLAFRDLVAPRPLHRNVT